MAEILESKAGPFTSNMVSAYETKLYSDDDLAILLGLAT